MHFLAAIYRGTTKALFGGLFWIGVFRIGTWNHFVAIACIVIGQVGHYLTGRKEYRIDRTDSAENQKYASLAPLETGFYLLSIVTIRVTLPFVPNTDFGWLSTHPVNLFERAIWPLVALIGIGLVVFGLLVKTGAIGPRSLVALGHPVDADSLLSVDPRAPIVYLRPFDKEAQQSTVAGKVVDYYERFQNPDIWRVRRTLGQTLLMATGRFVLQSSRPILDGREELGNLLNRYAPYIAFGRHDEHFRDTDLGCAKKFVPDNQWRNQVLQWLSRSAAVVLELESSRGISWEVKQAIRKIKPTSLLLILPRTKEEYVTLVRSLGSFFPRGLPEAHPECRLLAFDEHWNPIELEEFLYLDDTLEPFLAQNNFRD